MVRISVANINYKPNKNSKMTEKKENSEVETKKKREQRRDVHFYEISKIIAQDGVNIRIDYGDLSGFEKDIEECIDKIPPLWGHVEKGLFILTDGFRRLEAAKNVERRTGKVIKLPVYKEPRGYTDIDRLTDMFSRNDGKPLTLLEQAYGVRRFKDKYNLHDKDISTKIKKSITFVRNCHLLLQAPEETQKYISDGYIKETLVIELFKEHGIERAVQIIHDTIDSVRSGAQQLEFPIDQQPQEEENSNTETNAQGANPDAGGSEDGEFHSTPAMDYLTESMAGQIGSTTNPSGIKTDEELGIGGKDDNFNDSDTGAPIRPLPVRRITKKDISVTIEKFDSVGAFRTIWKKYQDKGWVKNPQYEDEFVFVQRILEGAVSAKEMIVRYFKFFSEDDDMPF